MDGALDTEQSAFSPLKQTESNQSLLITYFPNTPKQWKSCKVDWNQIWWD